MMRRSIAWYTLCSLLGGFALLFSGCADNQIGRQCLNPSTPVKNGVTFINPAPDCPSRLCMITPPSTNPLAQPDHAMSGKNLELEMCTAECNTDDDCKSMYENSSRCSKFVCAVPSVVPGAENFCCQKLCMCNADLTPGLNVDDPRSNKLPRDDFGVAIPQACRADNPHRCSLK